MAENVYLDYVDYKNLIVKMEQKHVYCQILLLLLNQAIICYSLTLGWWSTKFPSIIQALVCDFSFI